MQTHGRNEGWNRLCASLTLTCRDANAGIIRHFAPYTPVIEFCMNHRGMQRGMRAIALLEAIKGALVLLAGFGAFRLMHRDVRSMAVELVGWLGLQPEGKYSSWLIDGASKVTVEWLWLFVGFALLYSTFRFLEAYGLWRQRAWAEWLALVSGAIYLPVEIYEVARRCTPIRVGVLSGNLVIVLFMAAVLWKSHKEKQVDGGVVMACEPADG